MKNVKQYSKGIIVMLIFRIIDILFLNYGYDSVILTFHTFILLIIIIACSLRYNQKQLCLCILGMLSVYIITLFLEVCFKLPSGLLKLIKYLSYYGEEYRYVVLWDGVYILFLYSICSCIKFLLYKISQVCIDKQKKI